MAVKNCWDEVTMLPCFGAGALTDSLSPMVADGWAVMEPACQYCSHSRRIKLMRPYGTTAILHVVHWKSGPYSAATTLKPSGTL